MLKFKEQVLDRSIRWKGRRFRHRSVSMSSRFRYRICILALFFLNKRYYLQFSSLLIALVDCLISIIIYCFMLNYDNQLSCSLMSDGSLALEINKVFKITIKLYFLFVYEQIQAQLTNHFPFHVSIHKQKQINLT